MLYLWIHLIIQANFQQRLGNRMFFFHAQFIFSSECFPTNLQVCGYLLSEGGADEAWLEQCCTSEGMQRSLNNWHKTYYMIYMLWHAALKHKSPLKLELILVNWYYPINFYLEVLDRCYWSYFNKLFIGVRILHIFSMNYHFFCCI